MTKSGIILSIVSFIVFLIAGLIFPICCSPISAVIIGLLAGFLAGNFDKPSVAGDAAKKGAGAGAIAGIGAFIGQMIAGLIASAISAATGTNAEIAKMLNLPQTDFSNPAAQAGQWVGALGAGCCFGLLDIAFLAGLGALGGFLWFQFVGKKSDAGSMPVA